MRRLNERKLRGWVRKILLDDEIDSGEAQIREFKQLSMGQWLAPFKGVVDNFTAGVTDMFNVTKLNLKLLFTWSGSKSRRIWGEWEKEHQVVKDFYASEHGGVGKLVDMLGGEDIQFISFLMNPPVYLAGKIVGVGYDKAVAGLVGEGSHHDKNMLREQEDQPEPKKVSVEEATDLAQRYFQDNPGLLDKLTARRGNFLEMTRKTIDATIDELKKQASISIDAINANTPDELTAAIRKFPGADLSGLGNLPNELETKAEEMMATDDFKAKFEEQAGKSFADANPKKAREFAIKLVFDAGRDPLRIQLQRGLQSFKDQAKKKIAAPMKDQDSEAVKPLWDILKAGINRIENEIKPI